jgi:hypothetical protein
VVFATDPESAQRLRARQREGVTGAATVVGEGLVAGDRVLSLEELLDKGSILDTAERAQSFRAVSRQITPQSDALWHASDEGIVRLTHAAAMGRINPALEARPARDGDVAYVSGPRADLATRLALATFVGDGRTTTALDAGHGPEADVSALRPHKMVVDGGWLEAMCRDRGPRWPAGLDRPWARRRLIERLGDRLRWVEARTAVDEPTIRALDAAGVTLEVTTDGTGGPGPETDSQTVH